jgi:hypothetical protein
MALLDVSMNGIKVGEYQRDRRGANIFTYDSNWLSSCRPILDYANTTRRLLSNYSNLSGKKI